MLQSDEGYERLTSVNVEGPIVHTVALKLVPKP